MKKVLITVLASVCFAFFAYSQEKTDPTPVKDQPKAVYQLGKAVVTVWETQREGEYGEFTALSFKVENIYKKGDQWESASTFNLNELLQLQAVIDKAISEEGVKVKVNGETSTK
jgi:hypothetical protein